MLVFPAFKVSPGSPIEALGIFYQQTARYVIDNPDDVTADEKQIIDTMLGYQTIKDRYNPVLIDPLKGYGYLRGVETWPSGEQIQQYLQVYLAQGLRHPESYFNAMGSLEAGWFYPWSYGDGTVFELSELAVDGHKIGPVQGLTITRPAEIAQITTPVVQFEKGLAGFPVIRVLYTPSLYILFIPLLASLLFYKGNRRYLGVMVPVWISFAFLFIAPATGPNYEALRYVMPFIYTAPLVMAFALTCYYQQRSGTEGRG
ncbi:hypothetical protein FACS1894104_5500 [Actinomycetota bacterium]|nr:hypothetical protein FACS1894104_5500 [Actinomycetota bacterium]